MKYLDDYQKEIDCGNSVVGRWMKLNIEYVRNGLENKDFYDPKKLTLPSISLNTFVTMSKVLHRSLS